MSKNQNLPTFGQELINPYASDRNPRKVGYFVKVVYRRKGLVNSGKHYQLTDKKGDFWLTPAAVFEEANE